MSGIEFGVLLSENKAEKGAVLLLVLEGVFVVGALGGIGKGGLGVGVGGGELGTLRCLGGSRFFGRRITDLTGEHFAVLTEEIHVRVAADFAAHGLDESHRFYLTHKK